MTYNAECADWLANFCICKKKMRKKSFLTEKKKIRNVIEKKHPAKILFGKGELVQLNKQLHNTKTLRYFFLLLKPIIIFLGIYGNNIQTHTQKKTYPIIYIEMNIETKEGFTTFFCLFLQGRGQKDGI